MSIADIRKDYRAARSKIRRVMDPPPSLLWWSMGG